MPSWLRVARGRRLAVLGADGFIGSQVVRAALAASAQVTAISLRDPWRLLGVAGPDLRHASVFEWWDPSSLPELRGLLRGVDALALLAYRPPPASADSVARLEHELSVNAGSACRLAKAAFELGLRVVFASSADVYGPWHEAPVTEESLPNPVTPYARAKLRAEQLVAEAGEASVSVRIATVFGPGEHGPRAIPSFLRALARGERPVVHGDGSDVRDYVYVGDVAAAIVNACLAPPGSLRANVLNLGSGRGRTTLQILRSVCALLGAACDPRYEPHSRERSRLVLDPSRARYALGFEASEEFDELVAEEARWLLGPPMPVRARR